MNEAQSALGSYLLTKRMERSGESIPEYLAGFVTPSSPGVISESYYRDIESGRKQIRPQTADRLREQLNLDSKAFYYCLLRDLLPEDVFNELVSASAIATFRSASDRIEKLEYRTRQSSRAILNTMTDNITELDADEIEAISADTALLGAIHFIYNRDSASFDEIDDVYRQCGGENIVSESLSGIFRENTIFVDQIERRVFRRSKVLRIPRTAKGDIFKCEFVRFETDKSLKARRISRLADGPGTLCYNSIIPISRKFYEEIELDGIGRLMSIVESGDRTLDVEDTKPFFVSIVFSTREEYDVNYQAKERNIHGSSISQ